MPVFALIGNLFKVFFFFAKFFTEKDKKKSEAKKVVADEITEAFKETDPNTRASRLNAAVAHINEL